jgi:hypothetical protein
MAKKKKPAAAKAKATPKASSVGRGGAKSLDKPSLAERYTGVKLQATKDEDGYAFKLEYKPKIKGAIAQAMDLDATTLDDAKFEAANHLECTESELPDCEYE